MDKSTKLFVTSFDIRLEIFNRFQLSIELVSSVIHDTVSTLSIEQIAVCAKILKFRANWFIIAKFINAKFYALILAENQVCSVSVAKQPFSSSQSSTGALPNLYTRDLSKLLYS